MQHLNYLGLGSSDCDAARLFAFLDFDNDGMITRQEFETRMAELNACMRSLGGFTVAELMRAIHRASETIDENGDGLISLEEFRYAVRRLELPLNDRQVA